MGHVHQTGIEKVFQLGFGILLRFREGFTDLLKYFFFESEIGIISVFLSSICHH